VLLADKEEHREMIKQDEVFHQRYWTPEEHQRFLTGLKMYGHKDSKAISRFVGTRNATQVRRAPRRYSGARTCVAVSARGREGVRGRLPRVCAWSGKLTGEFSFCTASACGRAPMRGRAPTRDARSHCCFCCAQVRTHAQKYFQKLEKNGKTLSDMGLPDRDGCNVAGRYTPFREGCSR